MATIHAPTPATAPHPAPAPAAPPAPPIGLLLVEPQFLLRRTVSAVARDLRLAEPHEVTSVEAAARLMAVGDFDALLISLDEEEAALALLARIRNGEMKCDAALPVAVTAAACTAPMALRLKNLEVRRLLLRPFKVKGVLDAIASLRPVHAPAPERTAA